MRSLGEHQYYGFWKVTKPRYQNKQSSLKYKILNFYFLIFDKSSKESSITSLVSKSANRSLNIAIVPKRFQLINIAYISANLVDIEI